MQKHEYPGYDMKAASDDEGSILEISKSSLQSGPNLT